MTLIHPKRYTPQLSTDEILQCAFDKYQITYQIIWGKDVIRPHLVESSNFKTLGPLKGAPILHHFIQKVFLVLAAT